MARRNYVEHARVTAICVNLALDGVEADIQEELEWVTDETRSGPSARPFEDERETHCGGAANSERCAPNIEPQILSAPVGDFDAREN
jgi:hypothetical protein